MRDDETGRDGPAGRGAPTGRSLEELERELVRLRQRLSEVERQPRPPRRRVRHALTVFLVALTVVAMVATTVATWLTRTGLDTGRFTGIVEPVLASDEARDAIGVRLTDEVLEILDLQPRLEDRLSQVGLLVGDELAAALELDEVQRARIESLPLPQLQDLAAPIASGLEARIAARIDQFVSSPEFERLLVEGTEVAHTKAVALLRGDYEQLPNLEVEAGEVRLNLVTAVAVVLEDLVDQGLGVIGIDEIPVIDPFADPEASLAQLGNALGTELPPDFGQLTVMSEAELAELQGVARTADQLVWVLLGAAIVLLALTIAVAPRRRRALVQVSLGVAAGLVITMALVRSTQDEIAATALNPQGRAALTLLTDRTFDSLRTAMVAVLIATLAVAAISYLAGRPPWATRLVTSIRDKTAAKPEGSDVQRYVVAHHDALRVATVTVAVGLVFILGINFWSVLILAGLVLLALWGLSAIRERGLAVGAGDLDASTQPGTAEPEPSETIYLNEDRTTQTTERK